MDFLVGESGYEFAVAEIGDKVRRPRKYTRKEKSGERGPLAGLRPKGNLAVLRNKKKCCKKPDGDYLSGGSFGIVTKCEDGLLKKTLRRGRGVEEDLIEEVRMLKWLNKWGLAAKPYMCDDKLSFVTPAWLKGAQNESILFEDDPMPLRDYIEKFSKSSMYMRKLADAAYELARAMIMDAKCVNLDISHNNIFVIKASDNTVFFKLIDTDPKFMYFCHDFSAYDVGKNQALQKNPFWDTEEHVKAYLMYMVMLWFATGNFLKEKGRFCGFLEEIEGRGYLDFRPQQVVNMVEFLQKKSNEFGENYTTRYRKKFSPMERLRWYYRNPDSDDSISKYKEEEEIKLLSYSETFDLDFEPTEYEEFLAFSQMCLYHTRPKETELNLDPSDPDYKYGLSYRSRKEFEKQQNPPKNPYILDPNIKLKKLPSSAFSLPPKNPYILDPNIKLKKLPSSAFLSKTIPLDPRQ